MVSICQFGAGRIGAIHAANIADSGAKLAYVVDVNRDAAQALAGRHGARVADADAALADASVDAVVIASSTDTHADLIERAAKAGKKIFCEKPVDLSMDRVDRCIATVKAAGVPVLMGFNRRFDPNFAALKQAIDAGRIGAVEMVQIVSRDPGPPPLAYVKVSGGLFRDMMIHDFDMARFLLGEEPVEVQASASCLVDPQIGAAGDVDSAAVTLRTASGRLCQISNSRRAVYGYDQRVEVLGPKGMLAAGNRTPTTVVASTVDGVVADKPLHFFLERYAEAYRIELRHFLDVCAGKATPLVGIDDGRRALRLAEAANESLASRRAVAV
ncbi:MAG: inositol 2-dehydrogenase [Alphaproteobacteria bacterium]|nr:inositol 2-dehydrogenase [Alphaproteobacteria bacterium]